MKAKSIAFAISCLLVLVSGCAPPTIDATDDAAAKASIQRIKDALSDEDQKKFDEALAVVIFQSVGSLGDLVSMASDVDSARADMLKELDGKTAEEIISEADRIVAERRAKERQQALKEIQELEAKKLASDKAKVELAKFEVVESRFLVRKNSLGMNSPRIHLKVKNNTEHAISRGYFLGTLASPGRAVPWLKEDFNYKIRGGIEPGESATWNLSPNSFSEWGQVEPRSDMVFTVEVKRLDGADGEPLFDSNFSDANKERLETLKKEYAEEKTT